MQSTKRALLDLGLLAVLSTAIGFGVNAIRTRGAIKPNYNYFNRAAQAPSRAENGVSPAKANLPFLGQANPPMDEVLPVTQAENKKHLQHDYQEIHFPELVKVFQDPTTAQGLNLFVDARKPDLYEEGHIPGAMQCDPYEPDDALSSIVARANGVERVIVYCGGGDCEDSIFMCRELVDAGLSYDSIFLYPGGWNEWSTNKMPAQAGAEAQ